MPQANEVEEKDWIEDCAYLIKHCGISDPNTFPMLPDFQLNTMNFSITDSEIYEQFGWLDDIKNMKNKCTQEQASTFFKMADRYVSYADIVNRTVTSMYFYYLKGELEAQNELWSYSINIGNGYGVWWSKNNPNKSIHFVCPNYRGMSDANTDDEGLYSNKSELLADIGTINPNDRDAVCVLQRTINKYNENQNQLPTIKVLTVLPQVTNRIFPTVKEAYISAYHQISGCTDDVVEAFFKSARGVDISFDDLVIRNAFYGYAYLNGELEVDGEIIDYSIDIYGRWGRWNPKGNTESGKMRFFILTDDE